MPAASRAAIRCVSVPRIEERQVAGQHQPGGLRVAAPARRGCRRSGRPPPAHPRSAQSARAADPPSGRARTETKARVTSGVEQRHGALELRAARVAQRGLVLAHARAATAGEHQAVQRGGHRPSLPRRRVNGAPAAGLLHQAHAGDGHLVRQRLAHVVDGERGDARPGERFHLDAGAVMHADAAAHHDLVAACARSRSGTARCPSGWQNGMSSWVRLAAMTPAMMAVSNTGPFLVRWPLARSASRHRARQLQARLGDARCAASPPWRRRPPWWGGWRHPGA